MENAKLELMSELRARVARPGFKPPPETPGFFTDDKGLVYADLGTLKEQIEEDANQRALDFHKNNPDIRFDDCGFPKNKADRKFALTHDFGKRLPYALNILNAEKWLFLHGGMGLAKTALAVRLAWERMKIAPSLRPSYLCVNSWINSNMPDEERQPPLSNLRKFVVLDDFDKFDVRSEFQTRCCLRLIQKLLDGAHLVIITANFSIAELSENPRHMNFDLCLDRLRGQSAEIIFSGNSQRGANDF